MLAALPAGLPGGLFATRALVGGKKTGAGLGAAILFLGAEGGGALGAGCLRDGAGAACAAGAGSLVLRVEAVGGGDSAFRLRGSGGVKTGSNSPSNFPSAFFFVVLNVLHRGNQQLAHALLQSCDRLLQNEFHAHAICLHAQALMQVGLLVVQAASPE